MIKSILNRLKSDYFLPDRIKEYDDLIRNALENGYEIVSHSEFYKMVQNNEVGLRKIMMIRHDIDSDPKYCSKWLAVEKRYNVKTSYFFRLCTLKIASMKEVINQGSDCGYHYEELATYAKRKKIRSSEEIKRHISEIREEFVTNLHSIEQQLGSKIKFIASHGDFANRKLGVANHVLIDRDFLNLNGIEFETYDPIFLDNYSINIMDAGAPNYYNGPVSQMEAIKKYQIIHLLVHPKHWRSNLYWNTYENVKRFIEGLRY